MMTPLATLEKQEGERFAREFEILFSQRDFTSMASYYTADAQLMVEEREIIQGRQAIEEFWQAEVQIAATSAMVDLKTEQGKKKRTIKVQEREASGDIGYVRSTVTVQIQATEEQGMTIIFKDITIWKRGTDGAWQLAVDIANRDPAPASARM